MGLKADDILTSLKRFSGDKKVAVSQECVGKYTSKKRGYI